MTDDDDDYDRDDDNDEDDVNREGEDCRVGDSYMVKAMNIDHASINKNIIHHQFIINSPHDSKIKIPHIVLKFFYCSRIDRC